MKFRIRAAAAIAMAAFAPFTSSAQESATMMDGGGDPLDGPRFGKIEEKFCAPDGRGVHMILEFGDPAEARKAAQFIEPLKISLRQDAQAQFNRGGIFDGNQTDATLKEYKITDWNYFLQGKPVEKNCTPQPRKG